MKKRHYTFLYVPKEGGGLRTIRVPKWLIFAILWSVVVSAAGVTTAFWLKGRRGPENDPRLAAALAENAALKAALDGYAEQLDVLKKQVQRNFDFQKRARLLANLEDLDQDVAEVGVGGPDYGRITRLAAVDGKTRDRVGSLGGDIDKLIRQARLQRESYEGIVSTLAQNQKLLEATPSIRPIAAGYISSRFGRRMDPFTGRTSWHYGVDYSARLGTPIFATADGVVTFCGKWYEFGWTIEISHGFGTVTRYAHCSKLLVQRGQRVKRGEIIARVGSSGRSTATHLHYEVLVDGSKKNPLVYVLSSREVVD